ncbi:hypothetical protein [Cupriavidus sp. H39]|uniref:hypothetical protein n=1 Tax=Cupriavidus sp. H39 TaxID=3401635 RepID=UPI003D035729
MNEHKQGALDALMAAIARSKRGTVLFENGGVTVGELAYHLRILAEERRAIAVSGVISSPDGDAEWFWRFPGAEAKEGQLSVYGWQGAKGLAPEFLTLVPEAADSAWLAEALGYSAGIVKPWEDREFAYSVDFLPNLPSSAFQ